MSKKTKVIKPLIIPASRRNLTARANVNRTAGPIKSKKDKVKSKPYDVPTMKEDPWMMWGED